MKNLGSIYHELETDMGVGDRKPADIVADITRLGLWLAKELSADGDAAEKIPDDDSGSVGGADLLQADIDGRIGGIGSKVIIEGPGA